MTESTHFTLNGRRVELDAHEPTESLLRWLKRQRLHGTKEGCADGDCGACTVVLVESTDGGEPQLQAVNSCLLPMGCLPGREVLTVEALAEGERLHPVQQAMVDCAGSQCGYCTPGFVMSLFAADHAGRIDDASFEGNLCRCTGYLPIRSAAAQLSAASPAAHPLNQSLRQARPALGAARLGRFHSPRALEAALQLKAERPAAQWFAGGTDLGVDFSHGRPGADEFIALDRIDALRTLRIEPDQVEIGAGVPLQRLASELAGVFPALDQMLPWFAATQVRNRATLGGNLGTASPIGDLLPVLLALDPTVRLMSLRGERDVAIADYFTGYRQTARAADELILGVRLPRDPSVINASYKVAKRATDDISIVAASFALARDAQGVVQTARLAYGGVAAVPLRATRAEALLLGYSLDAARVEAVAALLQGEFTPLDDHRATADYRRALCANLFRRFAREQLGVVA